jgi:hypothetical protein
MIDERDVVRTIIKSSLFFVIVGLGFLIYGHFYPAIAWIEKVKELCFLASFFLLLLATGYIVGFMHSTMQHSDMLGRMHKINLLMIGLAYFMTRRYEQDILERDR